MSALLEFLQEHEEAFRSQPRLTSLYSDFSQRRATNPDGYVANTSAWLKALNALARHGLLPNVAAGTQRSNLAISYGEPLLNALQAPKLGQPLSLGAVIQEGVKRQALVPVKDFINARSSLYARPWAPSPYKLVTWTLRQVGLMGDETHGGVADDNFVSVANLEAAAKAISEQIAKRDTSYTSRVMSRRQFESQVSSILASSPDFADTASLSSSDSIILLTYLSRDKALLSHDEKTVKLNAPGSTGAPVTQQDTTIANLRDLISSLTAQCDSLNARIIDLNTKIKFALADNQPARAKSCLRTRKLCEITLQTRSDMLHKLESTFTSIENAAGQVEVVRAMEASSAVLAKLNSEVGGADRVEGVLELLNGRMDDVRDMEQVLGGTVPTATTAVDEDELEKELDALTEGGRDARGAPEKDERAHGANVRATSDDGVAGDTEVSESEAQARERDAEEELEKRLAALSLPPTGIRDGNVEGA